jgi:hypothetical protein
MTEKGCRPELFLSPRAKRGVSSALTRLGMTKKGECLGMTKRGARFGMTKKDASAGQKGKEWLRTAGKEAFSMTWKRMLGDKKARLGMREEGMLCTKGEVSPLDKTEILDKAKNYEKIPLDKALRFGIKEN